MGATPAWMARIIDGEGGQVRVELFADSIWRGLLDPCIIAAVLCLVVEISTRGREASY